MSPARVACDPPRNKQTDKVARCCQRGSRATHPGTNRGTLSPDVASAGRVRPTQEQTNGQGCQMLPARVACDSPRNKQRYEVARCRQRGPRATHPGTNKRTSLPDVDQTEGQGHQLWLARVACDPPMNKQTDKVARCCQRVSRVTPPRNKHTNIHNRQTDRRG